MIEAGVVQPKDIRIVETGGGFGGTWYYNRYPGLLCDIESYCYLPLLEETGYIPKHRYSSGEEIRNYANLVAERYKIAHSGVFLTKAEELVWDEKAKEWQVQLTQTLKEKSPHTITIRSQCVAMVNGVLNWPKLPGFSGISDYQGEAFHTSRWDYSVTGGSPTDPSLLKLQDKRVAIIGTGATAVQVIPHLARWVKQFYVIQRTPSSVDRRDQRETDPEWFKKEVANSPGWQRARLRNFHQHFTTAAKPSANLVDDQWTHAVGMVPITGNPDPAAPKVPKELPAYMKKLHAIDLPRQTAIRARVAQVVEDPVTAEKLQAWYPTWCKRPCFHDEYLSSFNRDNVTLVDTDGKGPDGLTTDSIIVGDDKHPVDIIIFATGFRNPYSGTPAEKANLTITGRNGVSMTQEWAARGPGTLHGVLDYDFPNLFLSGPYQAAASPNYLFNIDELGKHSAYILKEAKLRAAGKPFTVAATKAAADGWGTQVMIRGLCGAALIGCTPGYFNLEGALDRIPAQGQIRMARSGLWGHGIESYLEHIEAWRAEGNTQGIESYLEHIEAWRAEGNIQGIEVRT